MLMRLDDFMLRQVNKLGSWLQDHITDINTIQIYNVGISYAMITMCNLIGAFYMHQEGFTVLAWILVICVFATSHTAYRLLNIHLDIRKMSLKNIHDFYIACSRIDRFNPFRRAAFYTSIMHTCILIYFRSPLGPIDPEFEQFINHYFCPVLLGLYVYTVHLFMCCIEPKWPKQKTEEAKWSNDHAFDF